MSHTPRPWKWWTSCSWRRLMGGEPGQEQLVLEPIVNGVDGHPDIVATVPDMMLIAASPDLLKAAKTALELLSNPVATGEMYFVLRDAAKIELRNAIANAEMVA